MDAVEVRWPGGRVQRFGPAPADRLLVLRDDAEAAEARAIPAWPPGTGPSAAQGALDAPVETLAGARVPVAPRGRPTVVNFWAPWCKACEREMPALVKLAGDLGPDVRFVGVSLERADRAGVQAFAERHQVPYPVHLATEEAVTAFFGPGAEVTLPVTFVFGADGVIRRAFHREVTADEVRGVLDRLETPPAPEDYVELADRAHGLGQVEEERRLLALALAAAPDDPVTVIDVAERLMRLRDADQARAVLEGAAKRLPEVPEIWAVLAGVRGTKGDLAGAEVAIRKALALAPSNPVALNAEGMLLMMRGQNAEAAARFRAALEADPLYGLPRANLERVEALLPP
ncbi:MAG: redoxin domain-containing protein [bacterium]